MLMKTRPKLKNSQAGFAAIVIAIVLIIVLSLITVGFAQLMQNNQKQALNKQLSSQAYYAAESGVNDAENAIAAAAQNGDTLSKTSCLNGVSASPGTDGTDYNGLYFNSQVGTSTGASYTCLLINPDPKDVDINPLGTEQPTTF